MTSSLLRTEERRKVPIVEPTRIRARQMHIVWHTLRWALGTAWLYVTGRWSRITHAKRTRELLERLGFLFIKMGQLLSLRSDFFSPEFCREMSRLQYSAKGFPGSIARQVIENELGGPIEQFFDEFDDHPFAAASIAQLHRAVLRGSQMEVAVKVMRPYAPLVFEQDMRAITFFAHLMLQLNILPFLRWDECVWELQQIVKEEVDYRYEVSNLKRMRKTLRRHHVLVPRVYEGLCSKSVIVMEMIRGALMTDFLEMRRTDPHRLEGWMKEHNIDPKKVGERLFLSFIRQLFEDEQFHGDLHPGNIILLRDSRFALIDLGSVGTVEKSFLSKYSMVMEAIATRNYQKAADLVLSLTPEFPMVDLVEIKEKMVRAFRAWEMKTNVKSLPYEEKSMDKVIVDAVTILTQKRIMVSWEFMKIDRTWATLDASLNLLIPQVSYPKLFQRYFAQRERRQLRKIATEKTLMSMAVRIPDKLAEYAMFIEPQIRRQGREFQGVAGKFSSALAEIFGVIMNIVLVVDVILISSYCNIRYGWFESVEPINRWTTNLSRLEDDLFTGAIVLVSYVLYKLWRVRRRLKQREVRIPGLGNQSW